jgi:hypothetical protein
MNAPSLAVRRIGVLYREEVTEDGENYTRTSFIFCNTRLILLGRLKHGG